MNFFHMRVLLFQVKYIIYLKTSFDVTNGIFLYHFTNFLKMLKSWFFTIFLYTCLDSLQELMFSNANLNNLKSNQSLLFSSVNKVRFGIKKQYHLPNVFSKQRRASLFCTLSDRYILFRIYFIFLGNQVKEK